MKLPAVWLPRRLYEALPYLYVGAGLAVVSRDRVIVWANRVLSRRLGPVTGRTCYQVYCRADAVCPDCPVTIELDLAFKYYCTLGSELQLRRSR